MVNHEICQDGGDWEDRFMFSQNAPMILENCIRHFWKSIAWDASVCVIDIISPMPETGCCPDWWSSPFLSGDGGGGEWACGDVCAMWRLLCGEAAHAESESVDSDATLGVRCIFLPPMWLRPLERFKLWRYFWMKVCGICNCKFFLYR